MHWVYHSYIIVADAVYRRSTHLPTSSQSAGTLCSTSRKHWGQLDWLQGTDGLFSFRDRFCVYRGHDTLLSVCQTDENNRRTKQQVDQLDHRQKYRRNILTIAVFHVVCKVTVQSSSRHYWTCACKAMQFAVSLQQFCLSVCLSVCYTLVLCRNG